MNVSSISHLFQMNVRFAEGKQAFKQPAAPSADVLQQISDQMISKENSIPHAPIRADLIDTFCKKYASLEDMPESELQIHLEMTRFYSTMSRGQEKRLIDFKDRVQEMDQTIQGYQDILDGKSAPSESISVNTELSGGISNTKVIARLLADATQKREQFIREGIERLNRWGGSIVTDGHCIFAFQLKIALGENKFEGMDRTTWMIDPAADLYSEIDRVLAETCQVTEELNRGIRKIYNVLESRGLGDKYKGYLDFSRPEESCFSQSEEDILQIVRDRLMRGPSAEVGYSQKPIIGHSRYMGDYWDII